MNLTRKGGVRVDQTESRDCLAECRSRVEWPTRTWNWVGVREGFSPPIPRSSKVTGLMLSLRAGWLSGWYAPFWQARGSSDAFGLPVLVPLRAQFIVLLSNIELLLSLIQTQGVLVYRRLVLLVVYVVPYLGEGLHAERCTDHDDEERNAEEPRVFLERVVPARLVERSGVKGRHPKRG